MTETEQPWANPEHDVLADLRAFVRGAWETGQSRDDEVRRCNECGAICDLRVQVCECPSFCPNTPVDR